MDALVLILGLLAFALSALLFFEVYRILVGRPTISAYWTLAHRGRLFLLLGLGLLLSGTYIFLMGDLVFELW